MKNLLRIIIFVLLFLPAGQLAAAPIPLPSEGKIWPYAHQPGFQPDDALNLLCLAQSYEQIQGLEQTANGLWPILRNGRRVLYAGERKSEDDYLDVDVRTSMEQIYCCEPERPVTPEGYAPGRRRSYELLRALYGDTASQVAGSLISVHALGQQWSLVPEAARAFLRAAKSIAAKLREQPDLAAWLKKDGTFCWRKIAGERVLSAHSFGIAFDIGVKRGATYWRWSSLKSHPLQQTYAPDIVRAFEDEGFIWGGKWHEFDLMHFEYRPELICKAKRRGAGKKPEVTPRVWQASPSGYPH